MLCIQIIEMPVCLKFRTFNFDMEYRNNPSTLAVVFHLKGMRTHHTVIVRTILVIGAHN